MNKILNYCLPALILVCAQAQAAPILQVDNGILTGAKNVAVGNKFYDVEFLDGTCIALFKGCDDPTDFAFKSLSTANAASQALLNQVFVNTGDVYMTTFTPNLYSSYPDLTRGCIATILCELITPYQLGEIGEYGIQIIDTSEAVNYRGVGWNGAFDYFYNNISFSDFNTEDHPHWTYARWLPSVGPPPTENTVPEPDS